MRTAGAIEGSLRGGAVGYYGHHCERPIKFRRRDKEGNHRGLPPEAGRKTETDEELSDAELLALIGG